MFINVTDAFPQNGRYELYWTYVQKKIPHHRPQVQKNHVYRKKEVKRQRKKKIKKKI